MKFFVSARVSSKKKLTQLQDKIGIEFSNQNLLIQALTHKSHGKDNYERLEFFGDSILGFVVAEILYEKFLGVSEGKLSRMRSLVVKQETLAEIARKLGLQEILILGEGEMKSGGFNRDSTLSDSLEAIIAAIYLDQDMEACKQFIKVQFEQVLDSLTPDTVYKDAKSQLQEYLQRRGYPIPKYEIVAIIGEPHQQTFQVGCSTLVNDLTFSGEGSSRRSAEQIAAKKAFKYLQENER